MATPSVAIVFLALRPVASISLAAGRGGSPVLPDEDGVREPRRLYAEAETLDEPTLFAEDDVYEPQAREGLIPTDAKEKRLARSTGYMRNCLDSTSTPRVPWYKTYKNNRMEFVSNSSFVAVPPSNSSRMRTKVAFLMFVKDEILNPAMWQAWMDHGRRSGLDFTMHIHAYGVAPGNISEFKNAAFAQFVAPKSARSTWCKMYEPQQLMLDIALEDPAVSHILLLSQDSLPVKPLAYIYKELDRDPTTRMCGDDRWYSPWPRAETWWVMRRADAELFRDEEAFVRANFVGDHRCTEEQAWYYPLRARMEKWGREAAPVTNECIMFADWKDGPKACKQWARNVHMCKNSCGQLRQGNHSPAGYKHPVTFHDINIDGFSELVQSPFWFARKFSAGAVESPLRFSLMLESMV